MSGYLQVLAVKGARFRLVAEASQLWVKVRVSNYDFTTLEIYRPFLWGGMQLAMNIKQIM